MFIFGFGFAVPLFVIVFCYSQLLFVLKSVSDALSLGFCVCALFDNIVFKLSVLFQDMLCVSLFLSQVWLWILYLFCICYSFIYVLVSQAVIENNILKYTILHFSNFYPVLTFSAGSEGPGWVCVHPEGREGGDQDGRGHDIWLPGVLVALRHFCSVGRQ